MNIVFLDSETVGNDISFDKISLLGNFTAYEYTARDEVVNRLQGVDIAITNKTKISKDIMDACPQLKLICVAATGMNNIDLDYAAQKGIQAKNVAGYSTDSVVQITYGLLLTLLNQVSYFDNYVKSGCYAQNRFFTHYGRTFHELAGKRMGIIGMGTIGKKSAAVAEAFDAEVVYYSTSGKNNSVSYKRLELDELLNTSDIVCIHAPLNEQTRNLIDAEKLNLMKATAFIINTGRGNIVNESDLATAIDSGIIMGAGLDVFGHEPMNEDNPLLLIKKKEHLVMSPHIGWASVEARHRLLDGIVANIKNFLNQNK
ncbi:MAG: D-2-hydroxyacid dehydrogenase [Prevotellaceae bacterium]|jgi:glycerate dehydrogenase|nr:D-2-hydroxyacid dehydrogenase [Prevotellaceae bacterium]